jgi:xanthine dehydrogenase accessory factor
MSDWLPALVRALDRNQAIVRVVVSAVRGSTPREPGACMLVGRSQVEGTIGGGHLEWKALAIARNLLDAPADGEPRRDRFVLGATLGQCCGGVVELWIERISASERAFFAAALAQRCAGSPIAVATTWKKGNPVLRELRATAPDAPRAIVTRTAGEVLVERIDTDRTPLWLFGAGHVGQALVRTLAELPYDVTWVDERAEIFPASRPGNAAMRASDDPVGEVADAPPGTIFLVLTHRHDLDFDLCRAILARDDFRWAGVIGSATKAASFRKRLARADIDAARIARLVSPIGIDGIDSKAPAAIAVAVAAQLLQIDAQAAAALLPSAVAQ